MNQINLSLNEKLTIEMTNLSNERSLLAYMRTFVVFLSSGVAMLKIELFKDMVILAYLLIALSIVWLIIGLVRFWQVNKVIKRIVIHKK